MFTFNYTIKQEDLNYGNHVGNERALLFFQWAREEFLRANNLSETDIGDGSGFIQTEATVQYKKQLFLKISSSLSNIVFLKSFKACVGTRVWLYKFNVLP